MIKKNRKENPLKQRLGQLFMRYYQQSGMTKENLAHLVGTSSRQIDRTLKGSMPNLVFGLRMMTVLNIPLGELEIIGIPYPGIKERIKSAIKTSQEEDEANRLLAILDRMDDNTSLEEYLIFLQLAPVLNNSDKK